MAIYLKKMNEYEKSSRVQLKIKLTLVIACHGQYGHPIQGKLVCDQL